MEANADCLGATSTTLAPWHVVLADDKWNARLIVAQFVLKTSESLKIKYPEADPARATELKRLRAVLKRKSS